MRSKRRPFRALPVELHRAGRHFRSIQLNLQRIMLQVHIAVDFRARHRKPEGRKSRHGHKHDSVCADGLNAADPALLAARDKAPETPAAAALTKLHDIAREVRSLAVECELNARVILRHDRHAVDLPCASHDSRRLLRIGMLEPILGAPSLKAFLMKRNNERIGYVLAHRERLGKVDFCLRIADVCAESGNGRFCTRYVFER